MPRKLHLTSMLFLSLPFVAVAGCTDHAAQKGLATCNAELATLKEKDMAQSKSMAEMKAQLEEAQAKLKEVSKALGPDGAPQAEKAANPKDTPPKAEEKAKTKAKGEKK